MSWQLGILAIVMGVANAWAWFERQQPDDWASLWIAGMLVDRGQVDHLYDRDPNEFSLIAGDEWLSAAAQLPTPFPHPFVHNPFVAYLMAPLTNWMEFETSVVWLSALTGAAMVVLVASVYRLWHSTTMPWGYAAAATIALAAMPSTQTVTWIGQTTMLVTAGGAYALATSSRSPYFAGIVLGMVAAVKITPIVLIPVLLFARRRWIAGAVAIGVTSLPFLVTALTLNKSLLDKWWSSLKDINDGVLVGEVNQSLSSAMLKHEIPAEAGVILVQDYPGSVRTLPIILAVAMVIITIAVAWVNRYYRFQILASMAWGIGVAFSTIVWEHYLVLVVMFAAGILAMSNTSWTKHIAWSGVAAVGFMLVFPMAMPTGAIALVEGTPYTGITALITAMVLLLITAGIHAAHGDGRDVGDSMLGFDELDHLVRAHQQYGKHSAGHHRAH
ncbi:glycosyltransferase family 87 protein [Corynebacterium sp. H78]|uniref:glycosyltransferase family 87 protein n=1 Tax=Corynebacterium sp. H78 TaxID=3133417 RepID=UPI0030A38D45